MAAAVGGAIISILVEGVKNYALTVITGKLVGPRNLEDEIKKISDMLQSIQDVISDADLEQKQFKCNVIRKWLGKLKDVAYDMEDALDDCVGAGLVGDGEKTPRAATRWLRPTLDLLPGGTPASARGMAERLKSIKERVEEINSQKENMSRLPHDLAAGGASRQFETTTLRWETTPLQDKLRPVVGREEVKAKIREELLQLNALDIPGSPSSSSSSSSSHECGGSSRPIVSSIAIIGIGGIGKTTLAQAIFDDTKVRAAFDVRSWVFVGENFDVKKILKKIAGDESDLLEQDLGDLQSALIKRLKEKAFLIILDDCWCTSHEMWDLLWRPLSYGEKGGAVVVTTRNRAVAKAIPCGQSECSEHLLAGMSKEECTAIFKMWAFRGQEPGRYRHLEGLCQQIVEKLKGVPLAATMMGRYLHKYLDNQQMWVGVANDVERLRTDEGDVTDRVIELSYRRLPPHLKPCFAYCSIFPKGFIFDKPSLVQMWIAQGYVQARPGTGKQLVLEHAGSTYFDDLHQRSFFDQHPTGVLSAGDYYVMHDLINDFAQSVFTEGRQMISPGDSCTSSERVRHLSYYCDEQESPKRLHRFKNLRTLLASSYDIRAAPFLDVLAGFKYIRVLVLDFWIVTELPDSIRHLKLLRYLDVSATGIELLPEPVCDLLNLQVLKLPDDPGCALPAEGMSKLVNLRHLQAGEEEVARLKGIGKLTCLQRLERFHVRKESGWRIEELKDLNLLHERLAITGLEKVKCREEAELACLKDKVYLEGLVLDWNDQSAQPTPNAGHSEVLEGLCPPPYLQYLAIKNNLGLRLPDWTTGHDRHHPLPSSLATLELHGCHNWECLPPLGLLPCLRELTISGAHKVEKIGPEFYGTAVADAGGRGNGEYFFPRLDFLQFAEMSSWKEWDVPKRQEKGATCVVFPSLSALHIHSCPKLATLSPILRHLTALREMEINACEELASLEEGDGEYGWEFRSLHNLNIKACPKLGTLSPILRHLASLRSLTVSNCDELASLEEDNGDARDFPSLLSLHVRDCPMLASLSPLVPRLPSLEELSINKCPVLRLPARISGSKRMRGRRRGKKSGKTLDRMPSTSPGGWNQLRQWDNVDNPDDGPSPSSTWQLKKLETDHCGLLMWILPHRLAYLKWMSICNCDLLCFFTASAEGGWRQLLSLQNLFIYRCRNLRSLPSSLHKLPSLQFLCIRHCPEIECLPEEGLPTSLQELHVLRCPLLGERCQEGGPDHPKIPCTTKVYL